MDTKGVGVPEPVDADDDAEPTGPAGLDPGDGVLEDDGLRGLHPEPAGDSHTTDRRRTPARMSRTRS